MNVQCPAGFLLKDQDFEGQLASQAPNLPALRIGRVFGSGKATPVNLGLSCSTTEPKALRKSSGPYSGQEIAAQAHLTSRHPERALDELKAGHSLGMLKCLLLF